MSQRQSVEYSLKNTERDNRVLRFNAERLTCTLRKRVNQSLKFCPCYLSCLSLNAIAFMVLEAPRKWVCVREEVSKEVCERGSEWLRDT